MTLPGTREQAAAKRVQPQQPQDAAAARRWDAWLRATRRTESAADDAIGAGVMSACICAGTRRGAVSRFIKSGRA